MVIVGGIEAAALTSPFLTSTASAQTAGAASSQDDGADSGNDVDVEEVGAGTPRSAASDKLTNHLLLHGDVGVAFPTGSVAAGVPFSNVASSGLTIGGGIGLGLSRYVALDLGATYAMLSSPSGCPSCSGTSFDVGLGFAYHLAQGLAIDPWISFGVGYRSATLARVDVNAANETKTLADAAFQGLDLARIGLGGSFFPLPWAGIGPYVQLAVGTTIARPDPELTPAVYTVFHMGMRIEFDLMGRRSAPAPVDAASIGANRREARLPDAVLGGSNGGGRAWGTF